jgi:hypothetical protein
MVDYVSILNKAVHVSGGRPLSRLSRAAVYRNSLRALDTQFRRIHPGASTEEVERELRQFALAVRAVESEFASAAE